MKPIETSLTLDQRLQASLTAIPDHDYAHIAVLCHPHPLFEGTMNNKVVTTLGRTFRDLGAAVLRFNFRGVEESLGDYDEGRGEVDDALAAVAFMQSRYPNAKLWLGGFSFGGYVALKASLSSEPAGLVLVAPAASRFPMADVQSTVPTWVAFNRDDDTVEPASMQAWVNSQHQPPSTYLCNEGGHYYHGALGPLKRELTGWLGPRLNES